MNLKNRVREKNERIWRTRMLEWRSKVISWASNSSPKLVLMESKQPTGNSSGLLLELPSMAIWVLPHFLSQTKQSLMCIFLYGFWDLGSFGFWMGLKVSMFNHINPFASCYSSPLYTHVTHLSLIFLFW